MSLETEDSIKRELKAMYFGWNINDMTENEMDAHFLKQLSKLTLR